jgi:Ca2+-transporting ATPase
VLIGLAAAAVYDLAIPILAIQILAIDLLAEIMPLTFLAFDPPSEDLMRRPPRSPEEHIVNRYTFGEFTFFGLLIGVLAFLNYRFFMHRAGEVLRVGMEGSALYAKATTLTYLTIAYCQFFNILSRRYEYTSLFNRNILTNKILLGSVFVSIGLVFLGVYGPFISDFLAFGSIGLIDWLHVWGAALVFLGAWEALKFVKRMRRKANPETAS